MIRIILIFSLFALSCDGGAKKKGTKEKETTIVFAFDFAKNIILNSRAIRVIKDSCYLDNEGDKICYEDTFYLVPVGKYDSTAKKDSTILYYVNKKLRIHDFNRTIDK